MLKIKPEQIFEDFKENKLSEESALELLIYLVENEINSEIRNLALRYLGKIGPRNNFIFKIFENLLLSDSNENIRSTAAYYLIHKFQNVAYAPIKWALAYENSEYCLTNIIKSIIDSKSNYLKELIKEIQFVIYDNKIYFPSRLERIFNLNQKNIKYLSQIYGLDNLTMIEELYLQDNQLTEIIGIENLENLKIVSFRNNSIKEIKGLNKLTNLKILYLQNNNLSKIEGLESLIHLEELYLDQNNIKFIEGLENLKKLKRLTLNNNQIVKIQSLNNLENLEELFIRDNQLKEIEGLDSLTKLKRLDLGNNKIRELCKLDCLVNLKYLYLNDNKIKELKGLSNLTNLRYLNFNNNEIRKLKNLESLVNLEFLYLQNNYISEIGQLNNLKKLKILDLSTNNIHKIPDWLYSDLCLKELNLINCSVLCDELNIEKFENSSNHSIKIIINSEKENRYREPLYKEIIDIEYRSNYVPFKLLNLLKDFNLRNNSVEILSDSFWRLVRYDNTYEYFKLSRDGRYNIV
jgi:Leucine-rich repeat (LRR) protein